jgi:hypothetical protein
VTAVRLPPTPPSPRQHDGPVECVVARVTDGDLYVSPGYDLSVVWGPARWSAPAVHAHPDADGSTGLNAVLTPPDGTSCLVLLADSGIARPWVVAFDRWPA